MSTFCLDCNSDSGRTRENYSCIREQCKPCKRLYINWHKSKSVVNVKRRFAERKKCAENLEKPAADVVGRTNVFKSLVKML